MPKILSILWGRKGISSIVTDKQHRYWILRGPGDIRRATNYKEQGLISVGERHPPIEKANIY